MRDISKPSGTKKDFVATAIRVAVAVGMTFLLSGCMASNFGVPGMDNTDKSLKTSALQSNYVAEPDSESDEATVRNAVSSADISKPGDISIPWANTSTGSAGVINSISEENNGSYVCRAFKTTRHSYRGIANFGGKACLVGSGEWQMVNFKEIG